MKHIIKSGIAASALAASLYTEPCQALHFANKNIKWETKTICLVSRGAAGSLSAMDCDQSSNNKSNKRKLGANGCAASQLAIQTTRNATDGEKFRIQIDACEIEVDHQPQPVQL